MDPNEYTRTEPARTGEFRFYRSVLTEGARAGTLRVPAREAVRPSQKKLVLPAVLRFTALPCRSDPIGLEEDLWLSFDFPNGSEACRVMIVDESAESREVLCTLLTRAGLSSIEASRSDRAARVAKQEQPDLIVVDADSDRSPDRQATRDLRAIARRTDTPIVVLGQLGRADSPLAPEERMSKPYHYGDLLRRIEDVLEHRRAG